MKFRFPNRRHMRADESGRRGERGFFHVRGGRARRVFDPGDLRFVILRLLAEKPRHGYDLIKEIEDRLGGAYSPSPGVVYPTLTLLEELGYAGVTETDGKKLYAVTPAGEHALAEKKAQVDAIFARIDAIRQAHGGGPSPQVVRAMQNLRLALKMRMARGPLSDQEVSAIVTALDAAAVAIERA